MIPECGFKTLAMCPVLGSTIVIMPFLPAAASSCPLGLNASDHQCGSPVPGNGRLLPAAVSHTLSSPASPETSERPLGLSATADAGSPVNCLPVPVGTPRTTCQRTMPPSPPAASCRPSCVNDTSQANLNLGLSCSPSWSLIGIVHRRIVRSVLADASVLPSRLKATLVTTPVWPTRGGPSRC